MDRHELENFDNISFPIVNKHYFDTTNLPKETVKEYERKATKQDRAILDYMETYKLIEMTSEDIEINQVLPEGTPITSIRRAICNLHNMGYIEQCKQKEGRYGRMIYTYKFRSNVPKHVSEK